MDDKYSNTDLTTQLSESWQTTYNTLFKEPFQALYGIGNKSSSNLKRKLILLDGVDQINQSEWADFKKFLMLFMHDLSSCLCVFVTVRTDEMGKLLPHDDYGELMDGLKFEDRAWINRHIKVGVTLCSYDVMSLYAVHPTCLSRCQLSRYFSYLDTISISQIVNFSCLITSFIWIFVIET